MNELHTWSFLLYVSEWIIRLAMLFEVPRRRQPASATTWLLVIFFWPWPGLICYILFANYRLPNRRIGKHLRLLEQLETIERRIATLPQYSAARMNSSYAETVNLAEHLGYMPSLGGNDAELIAETDSFVDRLIADIDQAQNHVHLLYYIFASDETGRRVSEALRRAVFRGVKCRLLVDAVGSRPFLKRDAAALAAAGVELHAALPVGLFRRRMARIDLRNHRKLAIIDARVAYAGSHNLVEPGYGRKDLAWHDLTLRLTGPILLQLQMVFVSDWHYETNELLDGAAYFPEPQMTGTIAAQTMPSGPNYPTENYQRLVVAAIYAAKKTVTITTPYFVPDEPFLQAMQTAVLRGVKVEIVVPRKLDRKFVSAAVRSYFDELLDMGVELYLYDDGLLHAKTMCVDDSIAFIGSSNFDIRSFALNFEINLLFYGEETAQALRKRQRQYISESFRLEPARWAQRPPIRKLAQSVARLLSPLL